MSGTTFTPSDLEAYLDEALPPEEMARIEKALRGDSALVKQLASIQARRGSGVHSLGEIWRRHRLSCPSREQLAGFLLGAVSEALTGYIAFHVEVAGCRFCQANLADLRAQQTQPDQAARMRRRKYFQSSAGHLKKAEIRKRKAEGRNDRST
jgi:anti-sigma factor RsiW